MRRDGGRREPRRGRGLADALTAAPAARGFAALLLCATAACAPALPPPEWPPVEATERAPARVEPERSLLIVAAHVDLSPFGAALEGALASLGPSERRGRIALPIDGGALRWELARAPLALTVTPPGGGDGPGDAVVRVTERLALALSFEAGAAARCATQDAAVTITVEGTPILASGDGLSIALDGARVSVDVEGSARCSAGAAQITVALGPLVRPLLSPVARLATAALAEARVTLPDAERTLLAHLDAPIAITRPDGTPACLDLRPGALVLGPIAADARRAASLDVALGLEVAPLLSLAPCPPPPPTPGRPIRSLRVARAPLAERFSVAMHLSIPLAAVEAELRAAFSAAAAAFPSGRRAVRFGAPSLRAARGRLIVFVPVDGALHGALVLWGTPTVEPPAAIALPDLRLALASRSALERHHFAQLAADARPDAPTARARAALRRDLAPLVDELRAALATPRTIGGARLTPTIAALRLAAADVDPDNFRLTLITDGRATLTLSTAEASRP